MICPNYRLVFLCNCWITTR